MITSHIKFRCKLCNNAQSWYVMPLDEKTKSNDFVHSFTHYKLQCKKCGQDYILSFKIKSELKFEVTKVI